MWTMLAVAVALVAFGVFVVLAYRRRWHWTGLPASTDEDGARGGSAKTLWDWLQLLGIPVALAVLAFLFNEAQTRRDQEREDRRAAQQRALAADAERENTLQAYLGRMSELMLDHGLLRSKSEADVQEIARTATLTAVSRLDGDRRGVVVRFLAEAGLLGTHVDIEGADLANAQLDDLDLSDDDEQLSLTQVNLSGADLGGADLTRADLLGANLRGADLRGADLTRAHLLDADLRGADLREATLWEADLTEANLRAADLRGAHLAAGAASVGGAGAKIHEYRGAQLVDADLRGANLRGVTLRDVELQGANLRGARGADLAGARGTPAAGPGP